MHRERLNFLPAVPKYVTFRLGCGSGCNDFVDQDPESVSRGIKLKEKIYWYFLVMFYFI
jgi:hypothetical protein